jgi:hypothetical protein
MVQPNGRNFGPPSLLGRSEPPMAGDHGPVTIDQDRNVEAERPDAPGDLPDLLPGVLACIAGVRPQLIGRQVGDRQQTGIRNSGVAAFSSPSISPFEPTFMGLLLKKLLPASLG